MQTMQRLVACASASALVSASKFCRGGGLGDKHSACSAPMQPVQESQLYNSAFASELRSCCNHSILLSDTQGKYLSQWTAEEIEERLVVH